MYISGKVFCSPMPDANDCPAQFFAHLIVTFFDGVAANDIPLYDFHSKFEKAVLYDLTQRLPECELIIGEIDIVSFRAATSMAALLRA